MLPTFGQLVSLLGRIRTEDRQNTRTFPIQFAIFYYVVDKYLFLILILILILYRIIGRRVFYVEVAILNLFFFS